MKAITEFINGEVTYDPQGQHFWIETKTKHSQMLAELRGWGHIQHMFEIGGGKIDLNSAGEYQDMIGQFIADAINEKIKGLQP